MNTEESTETIGKDDWLMRLGDHGRTVIMAVPPTAHAMGGIHQQHDPVDVKSLGDAIHFAAHQCARAESVRGDWAVSASDWTRAPRPNAWTLMPRPGGLRRVRVDRPRPGPGRYETGQGARWNIVPATREEIVAAGCPGARKRRARVGYSRRLARIRVKSWRLQRADAWPRWLLRGSGRVW